MPSYAPRLTNTIWCCPPRRSMEVQNNIGADIMMALDDVVSPLVLPSPASAAESELPLYSL